MWSPAAPHPESGPGSTPTPGASPFARPAEDPTCQWPFATPSEPVAAQPVRPRARSGGGARRVAGAAGLAFVVAAAATGGAWAGATVLAPHSEPAALSPAAATTPTSTGTGNGSTANNNLALAA